MLHPFVRSFSPIHVPLTGQTYGMQPIPQDTLLLSRQKAEWSGLLGMGSNRLVLPFTSFLLSLGGVFSPCPVCMHTAHISCIHT